ncbi:MAG: phytoene/squalene synthase family protein [Sphingobacteriaceae bacterium]|nr:phytoene/squalene synthase family protein [Sphingobacteriaceae bacterium]
MKVLFDNVSKKCSKFVTKTYSTSFSLGISFLAKKNHDPIYGVYAFVRLADEIVDSFHDFDKVTLMQKFRNDTVEALEQRISLNPVLNHFQNVVHTYSIDWELIDTFLKSMEMDLLPINYNEKSYKEYIVGSAEVVGLMCLKIFVAGNQKEYEKLKPYAMKLGSAFQKVNFLRDINADFETLGRTYFPNVDFNSFSEQDKLNIENDIEAEFKEALIGIKLLPNSSKMGVYLAYYYYRKLFLKIKNTPATKISTARIRISNGFKLLFMCKAMIRNKINLA